MNSFASSPDLVQIASNRCASWPSEPDYRVIRGPTDILFIPRGSRLYALPEGEDPKIAAGSLTDAAAVPPLRFEEEPSALTLNLAQACNLSCTYCYADEGRFLGESRLMPRSVAEAAISGHIERARGRSVTLGFIGGEPLLNRPVLHSSTAFAAAAAKRRSIGIGFGITTNGALLEEPDLELFRSRRFAVSISLDGGRKAQDALRRASSGKSSFDRIVERIVPLLHQPGLAKVAARATITRRNPDVSNCLDELVGIGFREVGVSPLMTSREPSIALRGQDWSVLLESMKETARREWNRVKHSRQTLRFSNLATAWKRLYQGSCEALPCGAAAGYLSVSADGGYYSCHRTIGKAAFHMGDLASGPSGQARREFVETRHVDRQEPCRSCWARYLCGGGCHAEVFEAGRPACDYVRGWLEFCISLYPEVLALRPDLLTNPRIESD